jgi:hypothetical protein
LRKRAGVAGRDRAAVAVRGTRADVRGFDQQDATARLAQRICAAKPYGPSPDDEGFDSRRFLHLRVVTGYRVKLRRPT